MVERKEDGKIKQNGKPYMHAYTCYRRWRRAMGWSTGAGRAEAAAAAAIGAADAAQWADLRLAVHAHGSPGNLAGLITFKN